MARSPVQRLIASMSRNHGSRAARREVASAPPLHRALDQSERVKDKIEEAAQELADVNAVLKDDVATGLPLVNVQQALDRSEAVEAKVQEAADELVVVNETLAEEVAEREALEHRIVQSATALSHSATALTETLAAAEAERHRALHDALTSLPNVTLFGDRLDNALEQARRHHWRLAVMFVDLDGFKQINDTHGHDTGDRVLQGVATRLSTAVRGGDSVARRGGDEFLVLMLEIQDDASAMMIATKLHQRIAQPITVDAMPLSVGASIGMAVYPQDATTSSALLKCADTAMYVAKKRRSGVERFVAPAVT